MSTNRKKRLPSQAMIIAAVVVLVIAAIFVTRRGGAKRVRAGDVPVEAVSRRSISVTIEATGTVEPIELVEVKSKASGLIIRMPVQVGSHVQRGALLAQIDTRDVQNQYAQTLAALRAAQAKVSISRAQRKRADDLYAQQVITADEHENATLDYANAEAQLVKARTDLDLAQQRRDDATVSAPITGTVVEQTVSSGQVISSATSSASGGTTLLKMADLSRIRMRALVSETDIGNVQPGQSATVTVDAFTSRPFQGTVEKIEPQAVVQQSVTMFPVLIAISNENGTLLPGMNGEVAMMVDRRDDVPAVPLDAVRSAREASIVAEAIGLVPDSVSAQVQRQVTARMAARAAALGADDPEAAMARGALRDTAGRGASPEASGRGAGAGRSQSGATTVQGGGGGSGATGGAGGGGGRRWQRGEGGGGGRGAPGDSAARRAWRERRQGGGAGSAGGGAGGAGGNSGRGGAGGSGSMAGGGASGGGSGFSGGGSFGAGQGGRMNRAQVVFVKNGKTFEPRVVRIGLSDYEYAEVLDGVKEGEMVALLGVAEAQAKRTQTQNQFRQRVGGGMPGAPGGAVRVPGGGGGGGGGGSRSTGGGR